APTDALASIRLQVLNGSASKRLAARAAGVLRDAGYRVVATLPARERYPTTTILYQPGNRALAEQVAKLLGASRLRPAPPGLDRSVAVTVVVGADYRG
ncbi:MAG: LytR C-terminal domain-containing protein, partial [Actinomycetota bacterium]